jgi:hypothetical protein
MITALIIAAVALGFAIVYAVQPRYRKIFIRNLLSQVKYLIPRYFT